MDLAEFPAEVVGYLSDGAATSFAFSPDGRLLAVGCVDGRVVLWEGSDTQAPAVAAELRAGGHAAPVTGVAWARGGRALVTAGADWRVLLWDLAAPALGVAREWHLGAPVASLSVSGGRAVARVVSGAARPVVLDLDSGGLAELAGAPAAALVVSAPGEEAFLAIAPAGGRVLRLSGDAVTEAGVDVPSAVEQMVMSPDGRVLAVACADHKIRTYARSGSGAPWEESTTIFDRVDRQRFASVTLSPDGYHVAAALDSRGSEHTLRVWVRETGTLARELRPRRTEGASDVGDDARRLLWHPRQAARVVSAGRTGLVFLWGTQPEPAWSAYQPGFRELAENTAYLEREDEFDDLGDHDDRLPEGAQMKRRSDDAASAFAAEQAAREAAPVDVFTRRGLQDAAALVLPVEIAPYAVHAEDAEFARVL